MISLSTFIPLTDILNVLKSSALWSQKKVTQFVQVHSDTPNQICTIVSGNAMINRAEVNDVITRVTSIISMDYFSSSNNGSQQ